MLQVLSAGAVLFAIASTAAAGEHYVEVWNPPEARLVKPAGKCMPNGKVAGKTALLSHGSTRVAPRRIADPLAKSASASAARHVGGNLGRKTPNQRFIDIPRIVTPEGNILQVRNSGAAVYVVR
ncbi:hypothetical protein [Paraburkholderia sp.]|uniref:hypothetical protein n=1 Tax=Paraburkholderia sp. TaxID=1926495 RepID=UPI002F4212B1